MSDCRRTLPVPRHRAWYGVLATGALFVTACDTGDGKELKPYDLADYPSTTVAGATVGTVAIDEVTPTTVVAVAPDAPPSPGFSLIGPWAEGEPIDARYTCAGAGTAPALSWGAAPAGTVEIAIAMVDESAESEGQPFVHWVIAGLDPAELALAEGDVPPGAVQALNFFGDVAYGAPCPPPGDAPHRYRLTAWALNQPLGLADGTLATEFLDAIEAVTIGSTDLTGTAAR